MNITRTMFTLKVIALIALATLFLASMTTTQAQASGGCPCNFFSTFKYIKPTARTCDVNLELCFVKENGDIRISLGDSNVLGATDQSCFVQFICTLANDKNGAHSLTNTWTFVDEPTIRACRGQLQWIIWLYGIPECSPI
jgi:hypothetical protein